MGCGGFGNHEERIKSEAFSIRKANLLKNPVIEAKLPSLSRRGVLCVKSNMVYKLCKDIVYTFGLQFECVWNPNGA